MYTINVTFDGEPGEQLLELKTKSGLTWEKFILVLAGIESVDDILDSLLKLKETGKHKQ